MYGFIPEADGTIIDKISDPETTSSTCCTGINARGWAVGYYGTADGNRGFLFIPPRTYINYNFPGASNTFFGGINDRGEICGQYITDDPSQRIGIILQVVQ